ncbi:hypothetical protein FALBO_13747 [Fusarium albosuccineum]|uniref:Uncharacterized protein n=1 Tax=Fusarium albosuccineum TaxID=1237068 RepID=A0A8H4P1W9_9HYPO|nr:hypothetical protein FALBO_13747 [Fusarium albosuccineum]
MAQTNKDMLRSDAKANGDLSSTDLEGIKADKHPQAKADTRMGINEDVKNLLQAMQVLELEDPRAAVLTKNEEDESIVHVQTQPQESHPVEVRSLERTIQESCPVEHPVSAGVNGPQAGQAEKSSENHIINGFENQDQCGTEIQSSDIKKSEEHTGALAGAEALTSGKVQTDHDTQSIGADTKREIREKTTEIPAMEEERHHVEQLAELAEARAAWKREVEERYPKRQNELEGIGYSPIMFKDAQDIASPNNWRVSYEYSIDGII